MPSYTGDQIVRGALRELGVLDPVEAGHAEMLADGITVATDLLDSWRTDRLTIAGVTRSVYSLTSGTQSYTIGSGGTFNQDWPTAIDHWGLIADDDATDPVESPRGRPLTDDEWGLVRVKTLDAAYPTKLYYDRRYSAGLGNLLFWPIPNNNDVDVVLYSVVPAITALVSATSYDLRPGYHRALKLNLAVELADRYGRALPARLEARAREALGKLKRANYIPRESPTRSEFVIGHQNRVINIYTDD